MSNKIILLCCDLEIVYNLLDIMYFLIKLLLILIDNNTIQPMNFENIYKFTYYLVRLIKCYIFPLFFIIQLKDIQRKANLLKMSFICFTLYKVMRCGYVLIHDVFMSY